MCDVRCCHFSIIFVICWLFDSHLDSHSGGRLDSRLDSRFDSHLVIITHRRTGGIFTLVRRRQADQAGQACHVQPVGYLHAVSSAGGVAAGRPCLGVESVVDAGFCAVLAGDGLLWRPGHAACAVGILAALSSTQVGYLLVVGFLGGGPAGWRCLGCAALGNEGFCAVVAGGGSPW